MAIRRRNGKFQADFFLGDKRIRKSFNSKDEAMAYEHDAKARFLNGESVESASTDGTITLQDVYESVHRTRWKGSRGEYAAVQNAKRVLAILGETTAVRAIGSREIDRIVDTLLTEEYSDATVNRHLARLKTMLRHAYDRGWIDRVPKIPMRKERKGRIYVLTEKDEQKILAQFTVMDRPDMADLVRLLLDTGIRISNAVALTTENRIGNRLVLHADQVKGARTYAVPLTPRVERIFAEANGPLFPNIPSRFAAQRLWNIARDAIGQKDNKDFVIHACRHTFISRLVQRGVPLTVVKELAGHSDISLTLRYAHLRDDDLVAAISRLSQPESPGSTNPEEPRLRLAGGG